MIAQGSFEVNIEPVEGGWERDGVSQSAMRVQKTFSGTLTATSVFDMHALRTSEEGSACYIALERIEGTLDGREGSFVVAHLGVRDRGEDSLRICVVPGSGVGQLRGIRGELEISVDEGNHHYRLSYELPC